MANPRRSASGSSRSLPQRKAPAPDARTWATSSQEFESRIWPGPSGSPGSTSSSPVDTTITCGRGWTGTTLRPTEASIPTAAGSSTRPRSSTTVPWRTSSPASRTNRRGPGSRRTSTVSPSVAVCSTGTTVSAPGGTAPPVMIRTASPGCTVGSRPVPANTSPVILSATGLASPAPARSGPRTANPSMAELANGGRSSAAATSAASTQPRASARPTSRTGSGRSRSSTPARASANGTRSGGFGRSGGKAAVMGLMLVPRRPPRLRLPVEVGHEAPQEGHELRADVVAAGGQLDRGPQVVVLVAGVVAGAGEGVGDLDLVAGSGLGGPQGVEDLRVEDVAADHGQVGGGVGGVRLLDHVGHPEQAGLELVGRVDAAVGLDLGALDLHGRDHAGAVALEGGDQVGEQLLALVDDVVAEQDGERLLADVLLGHADGVAEAERGLLADVMDLGHVGDVADQLQLVVVALVGEQLLELDRAVEVVLDGLLAAAGDDQDVLDPGPHRLLDHVLDRGLVHQRQHLLGLRLGRREEAGPQPGRWDHGFAYLHDGDSPEIRCSDADLTRPCPPSP